MGTTPDLSHLTPYERDLVRLLARLLVAAYTVPASSLPVRKPRRSRKAA